MRIFDTVSRIIGDRGKNLRILILFPDSGIIRLESALSRVLISGVHISGLKNKMSGF